MRTSGLLLLPVASFIVALAACTKDAPRAADPTAAQPAAPAGDWKPFTSVAGRYSVTFPGEPTEQSEQTAGAAGALTVHFAAVDEGDAAYMVGYDELPAAADLTPQRVLDGQRDGTLEAFPDATIVEEKEITIDGNPGRALTFEAPSLDAIHRSRTFLVGNRVYTVIALARGDGKPDVAATFLDSFKLAAN